MMVAACVLALAFAMDQCLGDPRVAWHPVRLIGHWIAYLERCLRRRGRADRLGGLILYLCACALPLCFVGISLHLVSASLWLESMLASLWIYACLGLKDLCAHAAPIAKALRAGELRRAQQAVGMIVGRDVSVLDEAGVARAAIESVAENFVDACLAPLCCYLWAALLATSLGGDPILWGTLAVAWHRVTNTLDAMVGYRNEKYRKLGTVSARMDDVLNFLPARLAIPVIALAAQLSAHSAAGAWRVGWRDRLKHPSPNSAHAESAVAGALGISLGGPTQYAQGTTDKAWLGGEGRAPTAKDLRHAVSLILKAAWLGLLTVLLLSITLTA
ncbi:adenosylcobinamide-phosphate synthase CbiB [Coraliomargarita algicola]|uniref:Cobalamin biosynthesis protein CobD n=1 Tax=Coraliomargarita algicola TaxID=3092156 RepID=A0ABZ0RF23_9BACT|nr:adenosylcobinamide-phosphate synthase CbiB [Coraliomargarita sp. J2-16]WPJ94607.1 adenosylcobinamide-phosphate synthase CbiB [Coraliomargarita sp. J2-16]